MALESGKYTIISQLDSTFVGRSQIEPRDTSPKPIFKLPKGSSSTTSVSTSGISYRRNKITNVLPIDMWEVERLENGNYTFKANDSIVGAIGGLLFAIILEEDIPEATIEWTLHRLGDERDPDGNAYVIMVAGQQVGWVAPAGDDAEQIAVKPTPVGSTPQPTFSPSEVFIFKEIL